MIRIIKQTSVVCVCVCVRYLQCGVLALGKESQAVVDECLIQKETWALEEIAAVTSNLNACAICKRSSLAQTERRTWLGLIAVDHVEQLMVVVQVLSVGTLLAPATNNNVVVLRAIREAVETSVPRCRSRAPTRAQDYQSGTTWRPAWRGPPWSSEF